MECTSPRGQGPTSSNSEFTADPTTNQYLRHLVARPPQCFRAHSQNWALHLTLASHPSDSRIGISKRYSIWSPRASSYLPNIISVMSLRSGSTSGRQSFRPPPFLTLASRHAAAWHGLDASFYAWKARFWGLFIETFGLGYLFLVILWSACSPTLVHLVPRRVRMYSRSRSTILHHTVVR